MWCKSTAMKIQRPHRPRAVSCPDDYCFSKVSEPGNGEGHKHEL